MKKRFLQAAAAFLAAVLLFPWPGARALSADHAILLDAQSGRVLYEKDADARSLIASTTKIMTGLLVAERCNVMDRVRIPPEAVGVEGSSMYLKEGEVLTVQELLYGLMLQSGNDAAVALAIYCGGTVEGFAELMNDKARTLGLTGTHFENPNGLDGREHYSTARDLAILTAYAMENPIFAKTVSTKTVTAAGRVLTNHNKLLWRYDGAEGVKTGYTRAAGRILVSSAQRGGRRLIAVTINAPDDWRDHEALLDLGFSRYTSKTIALQGQILAQVEVAGGRGGTVDLVASEDFSYPLAEGEKVKLYLPGPGFVYAPVEKGDSAGAVYVAVDGKTVGTIPLEYRWSVAAKEPGRRDRAQSRALF